MRGKVSLALLISWMIITAAHAEEDRGMRFLNLTASPIKSLKLSPAGKKTWGANQLEGERAKETGYDKRIKVTGVQPGVYDVKFRDELARECILKNINLKDNEVVPIHEKSLAGVCTLP